jgi:hypothetical protein
VSADVDPERGEQQGQTVVDPERGEQQGQAGEKLKNRSGGGLATKTSGVVPPRADYPPDPSAQRTPGKPGVFRRVHLCAGAGPRARRKQEPVLRKPSHSRAQNSRDPVATVQLQLLCA